MPCKYIDMERSSKFLKVLLRIKSEQTDNLVFASELGFNFFFLMVKCLNMNKEQLRHAFSWFNRELSMKTITAALEFTYSLTTTFCLPLMVMNMNTLMLNDVCCQRRKFAVNDG